jgi:hypothetical protein
MSQPPSSLPRWLTWLVSLAIVGHLGAIVIHVCAATSGPWWSMEGGMDGTAPQFAVSISNTTTPYYLNWLKMAYSYHFDTNRPARPAAWLEARLKDADNNVVETLRFPDPDANPWVRHRQDLVALSLTADVPVTPPQGELIAPPGGGVPTVLIWDMVENRSLKLTEIAQHQVPRDRPVAQPSELSLLFARAYGRYLGRAHGAAKVELVRHSRDPIPPMVLFIDNVPSGNFDELLSNFGDYPR